MDINYLRYPKNLDGIDIIQRIDKILSNCQGALIFNRPGMYWANYIKRICSHFGVHPAWPLISLQREQSLLGNPNQDGLIFACGFVGQDIPGTSNKTWDGLATQLFLNVKNMSWYMGETSRELFGANLEQWPNDIHRWTTEDAINGYPQMLYDTNPPQRRLTTDQAEFCYLTYTPHIEVLQTNQVLLDKWIKPIF